MNNFQKPLTVKSDIIVRRFLSTVATLMIVLGLFMDTLSNIALGLQQILLSKSTLLSDYFMIGGAGAALINGGIVLFIALIITKKLGLTYNGLTIAAAMIVGGFALFGKNPINILPILLGNYLFAFSQNAKWNKYIYIGLFSTCLAPFVSTLSHSLPFSTPVNICLASIVGIILGFIVPSLSAHTITIHFGYNLFNVGFAAGFVAFVMMAILKGVKMEITPVVYWSEGVSLPIVVCLYLGFILMAVYGFFLSEKSFKPYLRIHRHSGRAIADFIIMDGVGPTFINMAVVGASALSYILLIGGDINGPTLGAIITATGFAAFGMHIKNCVPITLGVALGSLLIGASPSDPAIQIAAIFGLTLAPIAGQFGWVYGIIAGVIHCAVVTSTTGIYGGLNLYNNGYAAGIVAMVLIPLIESFRKEQ